MSRFAIQNPKSKIAPQSGVAAQNHAQVPPLARHIFCNRTLNLRAVSAIGYDMDYTLVHYNIEAFEAHAYEHIKKRLLAYGWPVARLKFDPKAMIRGLFIDSRLGNIVKANRFGFVKVADHGTRRIDYEDQRRIYARTVIDISDTGGDVAGPRFSLLNTFFTLSEGCLYAQLVDLFDRGRLPGATSYADIHERVRSQTDAAYFEGELKPAILNNPTRFIIKDSETPLALLDQAGAGKKLLMITNSDWQYTDAVMTYAFNDFLPRGMTWRKLFSLVIVSSDKPSFFSGRNKLFEVVDLRQNLLRPAIKGLDAKGIFLGGNSKFVEDYLGVSGDEILYVGDHVVGDVAITKDILRWRTALIVRELEEEIPAIEAFEPKQKTLIRLMSEKEKLEYDYCQLRLSRQRLKAKVEDRLESGRMIRFTEIGKLEREMAGLRSTLAELDERIAPLSAASHSINNRKWGLTMRTGNDKSFFARMVEQYADIYMSRVSNMLYQTPFVFLRSSFVKMPHDADRNGAGHSRNGAGHSRFE